jgi:glycerophosphoryl diester phosphodiesterase
MRYIAFLILILYSCAEKSEDTVVTLEIYPPGRTVNFEPGAAYQSFTVRFGGDFRVSPDLPYWCTVTVSDYLTDNLRISVLANETFETRTCTVSISADGVAPIDLLIRQQGVAPVLTVNQDKILVQTGKQEFSLDITTNVPFAFSLPDWITGKGDNSWVKGIKTYTFLLSDLPGNLSFREGTLMISPEAGSASGLKPIAVNIIQRAVPKIIAHRGFWNVSGSAQNSLSSLKNAIDLGVYGSELDVWITTDGVVVLNHDATWQGVNIEQSSYAGLAGLRLSNGEPIPTLQQCVDLVKKQDKTRLIIEIKAHSTVENENRAVAAIVKLVSEGGVTGLVDYISFSENICKELIKSNPAHRVYFLGGSKAPDVLKTEGYFGLDYSMSVIRSHPEWIGKAAEAGIKTNVWTVNQPADMQYFISLGVDFITTDDPTELIKIISGKTSSP